MTRTLDGEIRNNTCTGPGGNVASVRFARPNFNLKSWTGKQAHGWAGKGVEMLVLTRAFDERIMIGDDIEIVIVEFKGFRADNRRVRIGIKAPRSVSVHRKEIYEAIQREKAAKAADKENANGQT